MVSASARNAPLRLKSKEFFAEFVEVFINIVGHDVFGEFFRIVTARRH